MIPVTQTKVVVKNSAGESIVRGNCFAAAIASIMEVPITEVPNVEVLFDIGGGYWFEVMNTFLNHHGWEFSTDNRFKVFHDDVYGIETGERETWIKDCTDKLYFASGQSPRGVCHICIFRNGQLVHDPHPTREGILTYDIFESMEKSPVKSTVKP